LKHLHSGLSYKRLEQGRFRVPGETPTQDLTAQVFQILRDGIELGRWHKGRYTCSMPLEDPLAALRPNELRTLPAAHQTAPAEYLQRIAALEAKNADLTRQGEWFKG
jgi:hypothetical protein